MENENTARVTTGKLVKLTPAQARLVDRASAKAGVAASAKGRELLIAWARSIIGDEVPT